MRVGIDVLLLFVALTFSCPSFRAFSKASEFCSAMEIEEDAFWALCFFLRAQEDVYRARFANSAVRQRVPVMSFVVMSFTLCPAHSCFSSECRDGFPPPAFPLFFY